MHSMLPEFSVRKYKEDNMNNSGGGGFITSTEGLISDDFNGFINGDGDSANLNATQPKP